MRAYRIVRVGGRFVLPANHQIIAAMGKENIDVIHLTRDSAMLAVIVAEQHASRAADLIAHLCSMASYQKAA